MLMLKMMLRKSKTERVKMSWRKDCLRSKEDVMITYRVIRLPEKQRTHLPLVCACAYMHLFEIYFGSLLLCYKLCSLALLGPHAHRLHFACKIQNGRQGPKIAIGVSTTEEKKQWPTTLFPIDRLNGDQLQRRDSCQMSIKIQAIVAEIFAKHYSLFKFIYFQLICIFLHLCTTKA